MQVTVKEAIEILKAHLLDDDMLTGFEIQLVKTLTPAERVERALELIDRSGGVDGEHHKQWVLDQAVRVLAPNYAAWVQKRKDEGYDWDIGIAP